MCCLWRFWQLEARRPGRGQDGDTGKGVPAIFQHKFQGFRVHGDDHVELTMAVTRAFLDQKFPLLGARIPPQVHEFEKLV